MARQRFDVHREVAGTYQLVGRLTQDASNAIGPQFSYDEEYLSSSGARAISRRLPLQQDPYGELATRAFFEALLPEGDMRTSHDHIGRHSPQYYAPELAELGDETIGALVVEPDGRKPGTDERYTPLEDTFFDDFSIMPASIALKESRGARLSLAGAMAKVGLYRDPSDFSWHHPRGTAPSTHIVKAPADAFPGQVFNEAICMRAAGVLRLDVAETTLLRCPSTERVLLVSRRFDRPHSEALTVDGKARPIRLHQEDVCQALGYVADSKYDESGDEDAYIAAAGVAIGSAAENPVRERARLFDLVVFNALIGNCDAHLKNYALLYDRTWDYASLSPLYDAVSTTIWPGLSTTLGLGFAGKTDIGRIAPGDFAALAERLGAGRAAGRWEARATDMAKQLPGAIEHVRDELASEGFPEVRRMADRILAQTNERIGRFFS